jgi:hypothetical protein
MLAASAKFRPAMAWFARQIAPSVLATLIAALVIAGYNRAFSGHLQQPRMAALHAAMDKVAPEPALPAAAEADAAAKPKPAWATKVSEIIAPRGELERSFDKDEGREAAKDQSKFKVAELPPAAAPVSAAPAPAAARPVTARPEPREFRPEPRAVERSYEPRTVGTGPAPVMPAPGGYLAVQQPAPVIVQQPVASAPAPMMAPAGQPQIATMPVAQEPPPVITGNTKPMVTVPDRPGLRPTYEQQQQAPMQQAEGPMPQQRPGMLGTVVEALKPSSIFRSAREFGDKIEAAGNDILPNIRQQ